VQEPEQLEMPLRSWGERDSLRAQNGTRLKRWGSVKQACAMLWGCGKDKVHSLIEAGEIDGFKTGARNAPYKVDLLSVWEYKNQAEGGRFA